MFDEEATVPITAGNTTIILSWRLLSDSITPNDFIITHRSENDTAAIPLVVDRATNSTQFINLEQNLLYIFRVFARSQFEGENYLSLPVQVEWIAGVNSRTFML